MKKTVVVGMSGGVDSSVSALLLQQQGFHVIGLFMKNWEETDAQGVCQASKEYEDVVRVCETLKIPYYSVNFVEEYRESVFAQFLADYQAGLTPNPDILCNREIKFKVFLQKALSLGADYLATGHYCRLDEEGHLLKGIDPEKDQSYFLYAVASQAFEKVLFPIGHLLKKEVRQIAREHGLATSEKKDSTGICFIGERQFRPFLANYVGTKPGLFKTLNGQTVGKHAGIAYYTLGQRKGLGLGGEGDAWYVVGKDLEQQIVYVERGSSHPALYADWLIATDCNWIPERPKTFPYNCFAKVRYRQKDHACTLQAPDEKGQIRVTFTHPERAMTPGQAIVFYQGERCLGGGTIAQVGPSYYEMQKELDSRLLLSL